MAVDIYHMFQQKFPFPPLINDTSRVLFPLSIFFFFFNEDLAQ